MGNKLRSLFQVCAITILLFVSIEIAVRFFAPQTNHTTYVEGGPLGLEDSVLGHTNRPNTLADVSEPEFDVRYFVDENGFRADPQASPSDSTEPQTTVLLLGDSFTFGAGNQFDEIWPTLLADKMRDTGQPVRLINAGVPGYNTAQQALYLERLSDEYQPDVVVVMLLPNDLFANKPIATVDGVDVATTDAAAVVGRSKKKSTLHTVTLLRRVLMESDATYSRLYAMTPRVQFFEQPQSDLVKTRMQTTKDLLQRMATFSASRDAELVVVSVPQLYQVLAVSLGESEDALDPRALDRELEDFAAQSGITWVSVLDDLVAAYKSDNEDVYHRFDGHINARGNIVTAAAIEKALTDVLANAQN